MFWIILEVYDDFTIVQISQKYKQYYYEKDKDKQTIVWEVYKI
jgi:hypothetical protein